ncbi:unnamed protein product [Caenorhabditis bovis]|uniref:Delta(24)-sterol reductase n=1 Tax=Caenorhabditis bovis TaxID=2654633 RepID=A0A8S1ERH4_9PELO|nr:unnamed protein product [Caenorhabditis bovis]
MDEEIRSVSTQSLSFYEKCIEFIMHRFRFLFVVPILLPLSVLYNLFFAIRNWIVIRVNSAPKAHDRKVALIQKQIREWNESGQKTKMCTARSGWMTMSFRIPLYKKSLKQIRTDTLIDILELDTEKMCIKVEPMVTMGQITRYLIPLGYTLPIVPELDDLTVGGMINGCGVEASGKKYGMFQHICLSYELVMSDGSILTAKKIEKPANQEEADMHTLFFGIPWSHGTIGFLTAATIRIIKCRPFVKLVYYPTNSLEEFSAKITAEADNRENEFVEGLIFSKNEGVVMRGRFSDGPIDEKGTVNAIGLWYKKWFYTHVEDIMKTQKVKTEFIPLRDYYHRHSKSIFWELKEIVPFGNNIIFRFLMGWMCPPKISLLKVTTTSTLRKLYDRQHVLQDMLVPLKELTNTVEVFHNEVEIYPLWICPFKLPSCPGMLRQRSGSSVMYVDVGAYGITKKKSYDAVETTRRIEAFVRSVKGFQMLYADTYMTRAEFWEIYAAACEADTTMSFQAVLTFKTVVIEKNLNVQDVFESRSEKRHLLYIALSQCTTLGFCSNGHAVVNVTAQKLLTLPPIPDNFENYLNISNKSEMEEIWHLVSQMMHEYLHSIGAFHSSIGLMSGLVQTTSSLKMTERVNFIFYIKDIENVNDVTAKITAVGDFVFEKLRHEIADCTRDFAIDVKVAGQNPDGSKTELRESGKINIQFFVGYMKFDSNGGLVQLSKANVEDLPTRINVNDKISDFTQKQITSFVGLLGKLTHELFRVLGAGQRFRGFVYKTLIKKCTYFNQLKLGSILGNTNWIIVYNSLLVNSNSNVAVYFQKLETGNVLITSTEPIVAIIFRHEVDIVKEQFFLHPNICVFTTTCQLPPAWDFIIIICRMGPVKQFHRFQLGL